MEALVRTRLALDLGSPLLEQLVGAEILARPDELLAHRRTQLAASRDAALDALAEHLPEWRVRRPSGGLNLWCELPRPVSSTLAAVAERYDVLLAPGPAFAPEGGLDRFLRIPYAQPAELLREGIARIARAWDEARSLPAGGPENRPTLVA
jgi:DNA-binding transcriptional MocR family regulator